ncbi:MAG: glycosyltransferase family 2 protein, partial [Myxococcaceae bacterium]
MARQADVVVPIYGNVEVTRRCVEGVLQSSGEALGRVILVDDASPDPAMPQLSAELRGRDTRVIAIRNEQNLGFVGSANRGLALRERDVVLLNSDTLPTEGWLHELLEVAYSRQDVAAVTPLSNNGTLCSVPRFCEEAPFDEALKQAADWDQLERSSLLPTGVGFCLLMRDAALNLVGGFDSAFGRGYNEENDWCMRASQRGLVILRANQALVLHEGSTSFSRERDALEEQNSRFLRQRYPFYRPLTRLFDNSPEARTAARFVKTAHEPVLVQHRGETSEPTTPRLDAQLLHRWGKPELEDLENDLPYLVTWTTSFVQDSMFNHGDFERHQRDRAIAFAALSGAQAVIFPSQHAARIVLRGWGVVGLRRSQVRPTLPHQRRRWSAPAPL